MQIACLLNPFLFVFLILCCGSFRMSLKTSEAFTELEAVRLTRSELGAQVVTTDAVDDSVQTLKLTAFSMWLLGFFNFCF